MRAFLVVAAVCAVGSQARGATLGPPIAPAAEGKLQCYVPNETAKTCQSLAGYRLGPGGEIVNFAAVMISASPPVIMKTEAAIRLKSSQDCGVLRPQHIDAATFTVDGRPADAAHTAALRAQMKAASQSTFGHEVCVSYVPVGQSFLATSTIDGVPRPALDQKMIWVSPSDGYRVAP
jgi:hypothetical protein